MATNKYIYVITRQLKSCIGIILIILQGALASAATLPDITQYIPHQKVVTPAGAKVVLIGGCFDIVHYGHIQYLKKVKSLGNYLIIALEPDQHIIRYKRRNPVHSQQQRAEILRAIQYIDKVLLLKPMNGFADYHQLVKDIKPDIIAITADDPQIDNKKKQAISVNATVQIVTQRLNQFSSSEIINPVYSMINLPKIYTNIVQHGLKQARKLGFKTANIKIEEPTTPGVYCAIISAKGKLYSGMSYYDNHRPHILESHLFNYTGNLYGKNITVVLKKFIRHPKNSLSPKVLKTMLLQDASNCNALLNSTVTPLDTEND